MLQSVVLVNNSAETRQDGGHKDSFHNEAAQKVTTSEFVAAKYEFAKKVAFKRAVHSLRHKPGTVVPEIADPEKAEGSPLPTQAPPSHAPFELNQRVQPALLLPLAPQPGEQKDAKDGSYEL